MSGIEDQTIGAENPAPGEYSMQVSGIFNTQTGLTLQFSTYFEGDPVSAPEFVQDKSNITIIQIM